MIIKPMIRIITFQRGNRFALLREIVTTSCHFADNQRRRRGSKTKQKRKKKRNKKKRKNTAEHSAKHGAPPSTKTEKEATKGGSGGGERDPGWCCFLTCQWSCGGYGTNGQDTAPPPLVSPQDTTTLPCRPQTCEQMSVSGPGRETARRPQARAQPLTHLRAVARGNGRRGDGRSGGRRRLRRRAERPRLGAAAEDAGELRRELLHGGGGGGLGRGLGADGLGVGDANVGEDLPRQPAAVEVVRLGREAVRHEGGREGEGAHWHWQAGRRATDERASERGKRSGWTTGDGKARGWFL